MAVSNFLVVVLIMPQIIINNNIGSNSSRSNTGTLSAIPVKDGCDGEDHSLLIVIATSVSKNKKFRQI